MNRIIYKVLQRSLGLQHFECNLRNIQVRPVLISRPLVTRSSVLQQKTNTTDGSKTNAPQNAPLAAIQKKAKLSPKITLIGQNQSLTVTSLEEAQKLAKRRDLHLVLEQELDTKTQRPVYRLATAAEMIAEDLEETKSGKDKRCSMGIKDTYLFQATHVGAAGLKLTKNHSAQKKSEKSLNIGSRISEHDLASRLKNISKWLTKHHEVRILIQGTSDDMTSAEQIFKTIEKSIKEPNIGKIVQKRVKGHVIKFNILPVSPVTQA